MNSENHQLLAVLARLTFDYDSSQPGYLDSCHISSGELALEVLEKFGLVTGDLRWSQWTALGIEHLTEDQKAAIRDPDYREPPDTWPKRKTQGHGGRWKVLALPELESTVPPEPMDTNTREIVGAIAGQCLQWHTASEENGFVGNRMFSGAPYGAFEVLARYGLIAAVATGIEWTELGNEVLSD